MNPPAPIWTASPKSYLYTISAYWSMTLPKLHGRASLFQRSVDQTRQVFAQAQYINSYEGGSYQSRCSPGHNPARFAGWLGRPRLWRRFTADTSLPNDQTIRSFTANIIAKGNRIGSLRIIGLGLWAQPQAKHRKWPIETWAACRPSDSAIFIRGARQHY